MIRFRTSWDNSERFRTYLSPVVQVTMTKSWVDTTHPHRPNVCLNEAIHLEQMFDLLSRQNVKSCTYKKKNVKRPPLLLHHAGSPSVLLCGPGR